MTSSQHSAVFVPVVVNVRWRKGPAGGGHCLWLGVGVPGLQESTRVGEDKHEQYQDGHKSKTHGDTDWI